MPIDSSHYHPLIKFFLCIIVFASLIPAILRNIRSILLFIHMHILYNLLDMFNDCNLYLNVYSSGWTCLEAKICQRKYKNLILQLPIKIIQTLR